MSLGNRKSQHNFARITNANIPHSVFDRSHTAKDTMNFNEITPIMMEEILPGDKINLTVKFFGRLATQLVPIMDNLKVRFFFFFCPNRLVWDNWERFQGYQPNPGDSVDFLVPQLTASNTMTIGSMADKFDIPPWPAVSNTTVNALPFRAHNLIWNNFFRDQNLDNSKTVPMGDGPDGVASFNNMVLDIINKPHDYFTSALPWPQKGPTALLPLGSSAPVKGIGVNVGSVTTAGPTSSRMSGEFAPRSISNGYLDGAGANATIVLESTGANGYPNLYADLSLATAATINQLRQSFMLQSIFELDARGGTRYVESLRARFGVIAPDFRLQIPEYLGGGMSFINSHPVANTTLGDADKPQATLAAFSTVSEQGHIGFNHSFVEHGYLIGYAVAGADLTYQQGLDKKWSRRTRFDFYEPKLSELGEQAILNKEIYLQGTSADNDVYGYQERHGEYRYAPSRIRGQFRSTAAQPLDMWHMAEEFSALPVLNAAFMKQKTPIERAIAVTDEPDLLMDYWFQMRHVRPMVSYAVPATLGRF